MTWSSEAMRWPRSRLASRAVIDATLLESWVDVISPWPAMPSASERLMVVQSVPPRAWISWNSKVVGDHQISGDVVSMVKMLICMDGQDEGDGVLIASSRAQEPPASHCA